jgi:hypothetical protein
MVALAKPLQGLMRGQNAIPLGAEPAAPLPSLNVTTSWVEEKFCVFCATPGKALKTRMALPDWAIYFDCHTWAQFFLKYVISHPAVTCVIPRTGNPHHMADNLMAGFGEQPDQDTRLKMEAFIDNLN